MLGCQTILGPFIAVPLSLVCLLYLELYSSSFHLLLICILCFKVTLEGVRYLFKQLSLQLLSK